MSDHLQAFAMIPNRAALDNELPPAALRWLCIIAACRDSKTGWTRLSQARAGQMMGLSEGTNGSWISRLTRQLVERGYIDHIPGKGRSLSRFRVIYDAPRQSVAEMAAEDAEDESDAGAPYDTEGTGPLTPSTMERATPSGSEGQSILSLYQSTCTHKGISVLVSAQVASQVMGAWNALAEEKGLASIRAIDAARARALAARLLENELSGVLEAIAAVGRSEFCCGAKGWRMDFDTMLTPAKMKKLLEGGFDPARPASPQHTTVAEMQGW